jgi:acetyl-CoA carboxylase biotin carboxyl carrier protein
VNLDDVREILALMREHGISEFEIEREGLKLRLRKDSAPPAVASVPVMVAGVPAASLAPVVPAAELPVAALPVAGHDTEVELAVVKSPIVGTFYRSPEPGAASFVEIGTTVKKGQVLCIIEAMKLMNEIDSEYDGEIVNIYVENGQPVQYGERLFAIRTA